MPGNERNNFLNRLDQVEIDEMLKIVGFVAHQRMIQCVGGGIKKFFLGEIL